MEDWERYCCWKAYQSAGWEVTLHDDGCPDDVDAVMDDLDRGIEC